MEGYNLCIGYFGIKDDFSVESKDDDNVFVVVDPKHNHIAMNVITGEIYPIYTDDDLLLSSYIPASLPKGIKVICRLKTIILDDVASKDRQLIVPKFHQNIKRLQKRIDYEKKGRVITLNKDLKDTYLRDDL